MDFFITYGDQKFKKSRNRLIKEAQKFGFDYTKAYSKKDLTDEFIQLTSPVINYSRGGGYWIWKAFILKDIFTKMKVGDVVVYLDAGCKINLEGRLRYLEYLEILDKNNGFLAFHLEECFEYMYTNQNTFNFFGVQNDSKIYNSQMYVGGVLMFKKNDTTIKFIDEFYFIATNFPQLFSDNNSFSFDNRYVEHRHDQSILSLLRKKYSVDSIPDESCSVQWCDLKFSPFHAMRIIDIPIYLKVVRRVNLLIKKFFL